ncbi:Putative uncharacterized protein [Streptococcus gallolyticus]|uniref:Uncharacterized protein n=1 Tax=Streptococcus gallolyticus TaxID=315405 RepID=A0A060RGU9_9STRE|nr:hypothetical protein [Streptococcus gallolyticus]CDO17733.1 Putative uncharacterized protein [Streptococcus gallolyticus]
MIIFVSIKKLVQTFWWLIAAIAFYIFLKTIGLSMAFLLVLGLLALYFAPALFVPILLIAICVHFSGGFSFIPELLTSAFWLIIMGIIFLIVVGDGGQRAIKHAEKKALKERQLSKKQGSDKK